MKAIINLDTKAKFFALYWGQDILCSDMYGDGGTIYSATMKGSSIKNEWLQLKPLSSISDEDAIEVAKIFDPNKNHGGWDQILSVKSSFHGIFNADYNDSIDEVTPAAIDHVFTFLRSRGYLVPWMGLSCEELIEAGWAKYSEE